MDILEIDAVSFAARTAQVAAAELYGLLSTGGILPTPDWYDDTIRTDAEIEADVEAMSGYVLKRLAGGETLWRWNRECGRVLASGGFADQPFARQQAYELFAATVATVGSKLLDVQRRREAELERDRQAALRQAQGGPKLEDTIYEKEESLGAMRPEAVAAASQIAAYDQAQAEEKAHKKAERKARREAERQTAAAQAAKHPRQRAPMSVGETPPAKPVNRGGRGKTKQKG